MGAKRKFWIIGIALAIIGLVVGRVVSRLFGSAELQAAIYIVGVILALGGLGVIMYGIRKR